MYIKTPSSVHFFTLMCTAPSQEADKDLSALCQLWLESKDHVIVKVVNVLYAFSQRCNGTLADFWFYVCFTARGRGGRRAHSSNTQSVGLLNHKMAYSNNNCFVFLAETGAHTHGISCCFFYSLLGGLTMWWDLVQERKGMFFKSRLVLGMLSNPFFFYIVALLLECSLLLFFQSLCSVCVF